MYAECEHFYKHCVKYFVAIPCVIINLILKSFLPHVQNKTIAFCTSETGAFVSLRATSLFYNDVKFVYVTESTHIILANQFQTQHDYS